jgi:hypothetical protein
MVPSGARRSIPLGVATAFVYVVALFLFLTYANDNFTLTQRLLAWLIFVAGTLPVVRFLMRPRGVPLLEFVNVQFVVLFALPVFYETRLSTLHGYRVPAENAITMALFCALAGLLALGLGFRFARRTIRVRVGLLSFPASELRLFVLAVLMVVGAIMLFSGAVPVSAGLMQPLLVIVSQDLGLTILALQFYQGSLLPWQKNVARAVFGTTLVIGLVGGSTQGLLQPVLIWMTCKWVITRKGPTRFALIMGAAFFMLQPVKSAYRSEVWYGHESYSLLGKIGLYQRLIVMHWSKMFTEPDAITDQVRSSASERLSLLMSTAHYVELTPSQVDFKNGSTLAYMAYGWIPRFLWTDKPIAQMANKLLPVEYGIQSEVGTQTAMFGVGSVAEVYANFGVYGIIPVFFILGILYQLPVSLVGSARSTAEYAIVLAALLNVMWIGSTISHAFGGIVQQVLVQAIVLRAFTQSRGPAVLSQAVSSGSQRASLGASPARRP